MTTPGGASVRTSDDRPAEEFCGFCGHHMDPHDYSGTTGEVPCTECPDGICPRATFHNITDGSATTSCCGKTPFELPQVDRITTEPGEATCRPRVATRPKVSPCTGLTARWCPVHGDCACPDDSIPELHVTATLDDPQCPLHKPGSGHGHA